VTRPALVAIEVLFAVGAILVADSTGLSLGLGALSASFLCFAGLFALADRMPPLPPLVLPARSQWQSRVRRSLAGDDLARLEVLEELDRILPPEKRPGGHLLQDDRARILKLPRADFESFLREHMDAADR
jgi:hypothetical protein